MIFVDGPAPETESGKRPGTRGNCCAVCDPRLPPAARRSDDQPPRRHRPRGFQGAGKNFQDGIKQAIATCLASPRSCSAWRSSRSLTIRPRSYRSTNIRSPHAFRFLSGARSRTTNCSAWLSTTSSATICAASGPDAQGPALRTHGEKFHRPMAARPRRPDRGDQRESILGTDTNREAAETFDPRLAPTCSARRKCSSTSSPARTARPRN